MTREFEITVSYTFKVTADSRMSMRAVLDGLYQSFSDEVDGRASFSAEMISNGVRDCARNAIYWMNSSMAHQISSKYPEHIRWRLQSRIIEKLSSSDEHERGSVSSHFRYANFKVRSTKEDGTEECYEGDGWEKRP